MTIEPEEYVALNQPENENPSTVSFVQDNYETLKNKIKNVGIGICAVTLILLNFTQLVAGLIMIKHCPEDNYTPAYFIVAGLLGSVPKIAYFTIRRSKRFPKIHQIFYPFYIFEFFWLMVGTYFYVLRPKSKEGCAGYAYSLSFWLIISNYICLKFSLVIFCWTLTIIFVLVYFKNKIVQFLAKSMRF